MRRNRLDDHFALERSKLLAKAPVPVLWLFGKTGSGKTSIIRFLTGAEMAVIGRGFRPETPASRRFAFPNEEEPVLYFLDTPGLGEHAYDPSEDIVAFERSTHLLIVTVCAMDHSLDAVLEPLRQIRKANPRRPVLLVFTHLHEAYPQQQHPVLDAADPESRLPADLRRSLETQRERFRGLYDRSVAVDITRPEEGFAEPNFGGERLRDAIADLLPNAYRQTFLMLETVMASLADLSERRALPYILGATALAGAAAAFPVPWVDIAVVAAIQIDLVRRISRFYGQEWSATHFLQMTGLVGGRVVVRQIVRETLKFIPILGSAVNAALASAYTYAVGRACCWYFSEIRAGHAPTNPEVEQVMREELSMARRLLKDGRMGNGKP